VKLLARDLRDGKDYPAQSAHHAGRLRAGRARRGQMPGVLVGWQASIIPTARSISAG